MNKSKLGFLALSLMLCSSSLLRAQGTPYTYVTLVPDTAAHPLDMYDREGGYARMLAMGAGGFGIINSGGTTVQNGAVGVQSYISNPFLVDAFDVIVNPAWVS